jgi:hypothetical protein
LSTDYLQAAAGKKSGGLSTNRWHRSARGECLFGAIAIAHVRSGRKLFNQVVKGELTQNTVASSSRAQGLFHRAAIRMRLEFITHYRDDRRVGCNRLLDDRQVHDPVPRIIPTNLANIRRYRAETRLPTWSTQADVLRAATE